MFGGGERGHVIAGLRNDDFGSASSDSGNPGCSAGRRRSKPRSTGKSPSTDSAPSSMTCNRSHVKTSASVATRNDS